MDWGQFLTYVGQGIIVLALTFVAAAVLSVIRKNF